MSLRRVFSKEFKTDAVELSFNSKKKVQEIAADLGMSPRLLSKWRKEYSQDKNNAFPGKGNINGSIKDIKELERELRETREERDILKKALAIFSNPRGKSTGL